MFHPDSYTTTIGSMFKTKDLVKSLKEAIIYNGNSILDTKPLDNVVPYYILNDENIKMFSHPLAVEHDGRDYLCTDLRMLVRKDTHLENLSSNIKNVTEYNFAKNRTVLNMYWSAGDSASMKISLAFAEAVYVLWLSDAISKTYALDPQDRLLISIAASYFYQTLFVNKDDIDEDFVQLAAAHTIKTTGASGDLVFSVIDKLVNVGDIDELATTLDSVIESNRLKDFNLAGLLTIVKNSWYGLNAKEMIAVGLEHPPTWIAMVFTAITERTYKNSPLAKLTDLLGKRNRSDEFVKHIVLMLSQQVASEDDYHMLDV